MKKIILVGTVACGKTTLCQRINGLEQRYKKTQSLEVVNQTIDTPGEYLERRAFLSNLLVASADAELVLFLADATQERFMYSPGQASAFPAQVIGVVTKMDLATPKQRRDAAELLRLTGADPIFELSAVTNEGVDELICYLQETVSEPV